MTETNVHHPDEDLVAFDYSQFGVVESFACVLNTDAMHTPSADALSAIEILEPISDE